MLKAINTSMLKLKQIYQPSVFWLTAFGLGFLRPAPGTWGSLGAVVFWWFFLAELTLFVQLGIIVSYFLFSWWLCNRLINRLGVQDEPQIVADEVTGMWLALIFAPQIWWVALLAFALFRFFDIAKPGLVEWLDTNVHSGLGVMLDDLVAGLLSASIVWLVLQV
jgi:phosphatidylglycerophosphatase A